MADEPDDHIDELLEFPNRCHCRDCRVVSVVVDAAIKTMNAMPLDERKRCVADWFAKKFTWTWRPDGGVLVTMNGRVLAKVSAAEVRLVRGPEGGARPGQLMSGPRSRGHQ